MNIFWVLFSQMAIWIGENKCPQAIDVCLKSYLWFFEGLENNS